MCRLKINRLKINRPEIKLAQQGFTLIEVMVSLLIISIGMLGVAGMQTRGMQSGSLATQRLSVIMKVQEISERIRINAAQVDSYNITTTNSGLDNQCFNGTTCTSAQLAAYDIYLWKQDLLSILPNDPGTTASITVQNPTPGTAAVPPLPAIPASPLATVTVTITWKSTAGDQTYITNFQVNPVPVG